MTPELQDISPMHMVVQNGIVNEKGMPLEFRDRLFLFDIFQDMSPVQVIKKCAQVGASVTLNVKAFFAAKLGLTVIYTMPSDSDVWEFAKTKTDKIIQANPSLRKMLREDNATLKRMGRAFIHFKGTVSKTAPISTTADLLIHDEYDRSDFGIVAQYQSRLSASQYRGTWYVSNPSGLRRGVDVIWRQSDQKEWYITCGGCKKEQKLVWEENVDQIRGIYVCKNCNRELTDNERRIGRWVAENPGAEISGYHISQMMAPWRSAKDLIKERQNGEEYFRNFVLGEPYSVGDVSDFRTAITDCWTAVPLDEEPFYMGIDIGKVKHYVIGSKKGIFKVGTVEKREDLESLIIKYNPYAVMDAGPERTWAEEFRQRFPKLFLNFYHKDKNVLEAVKWGGDKGTFEDRKNWGYVWSDRTRAIDRTLRRILAGETLFFLTREDLDRYIQHWESMSRVEEVGEHGNRDYSWQTSNGVDHFCHATVYYDLARERFGGHEVSVGSEKTGKVEVIEPTAEGFRMADLEDLHQQDQLGDEG